MMERILAILVAGALAAGCTALTPTEMSFLDTPPLPDADVVPCVVDSAYEAWDQCHDGCDNDGDGLTDCDDPDCARFCCAIRGAEYLACDDGCDNDLDGLIDCDDPECEGTAACLTPTPPETACDDRGGPAACCRNGLDDDGDGLTDCADPDCLGTDACCGTFHSHVDPPGGGFDTSYWARFGARPEPSFSEGWLEDWRAPSDYLNGVAARSPVDLSFGLSLSMTVRVGGTETCLAPHTCDSLTGVSLSPSPAPAVLTNPDTTLSVVVTGAHQVVVVRGPFSDGGGVVLHRIGLDPSPSDDPEAEPVVRTIAVDLVPAVGADGTSGFRMDLRVPGGRRVCHSDNSSVGCPAEDFWASEGPVLFPEDNVLLSGGRGVYPMVLGKGASVQLSDLAGGTVGVVVRSCANPVGWLAAGGDGAVDNSRLCWIGPVGALGAPSVARVGDRFAMLLEGSTREVLSWSTPGNFALGWLAADEVASVGGTPSSGPWLDPALDPRVTTVHESQPIDTEFDRNCMGPEADAWVDACASLGERLARPGSCADQPSRRGPHIVAHSIGRTRILYSEATGRLERTFEVRAADFTASDWHWDETLVERGHALTAETLGARVEGRLYSSVRDPMTICCDPNDTDGDCDAGVFTTVVVAEAVDSSGAWLGDDLVSLDYSFLRGFDEEHAHVLLRGDDPESPLRGLELSHPWLHYEPDGDQLLLWVTSRPPTGTAQLELLVADCIGCLATGCGMPGSPRNLLADQTFRLFEGSPVLTPGDLGPLVPGLDCSAGCDLGGVSGLRLPDAGLRQDMLHLWVGVTVGSAGAEVPSWRVYHLAQPIGVPRP